MRSPNSVPHSGKRPMKPVLDGRGAIVEERGYGDEGVVERDGNQARVPWEGRRERDAGLGYGRRPNEVSQPSPEAVQAAGRGPLDRLEEHRPVKSEEDAAALYLRSHKSCHLK